MRNVEEELGGGDGGGTFVNGWLATKKSRARVETGSVLGLCDESINIIITSGSRCRVAKVWRSENEKTNRKITIYESVDQSISRSSLLFAEL